MEYKADISIQTKKPVEIIKLFSTEDQEFQNRSEYKISKKQNCVVFEINAKDITSLRTCMNAILKALIIYEKAKNIEQQNG